MTTQLQMIHLTEADFERWDRGVLSSGETELFLAHTASCACCGDAWFAHMSRAPELLQEPPAYLADEILQRVRKPDVVVAQRAHTTSKKMQLFLYSLKVSMALAASIYMIFAMDTSTLDLIMNIFN